EHPLADLRYAGRRRLSAGDARSALQPRGGLRGTRGERDAERRLPRGRPGGKGHDSGATVSHLKKTAGTHAKVRYRCFLPDLAGLRPRVVPTTNVFFGESGIR